MSIQSQILEGLKSTRDKSINESYQDYPICHKSRELQKICSDAISKKYFNFFKPLGAESMGIEIYVHSDRDEDDVIDIDDVIYEATVYIDFNIRSNVDVKAVMKVINAQMRKYPKFLFDKVSKQFYATCESPDAIMDLMETLRRDGCALTKLYTVLSSDEVDRQVEAQRAEWKRDREYQEREYRRDVLGTW